MCLGILDITRIANNHMKELSKKSNESVRLTILAVDVKDEVCTIIYPGSTMPYWKGYL